MAKRIQAPLFACLGCVAALIALVVAAYKLGPVERLDASLLAWISTSSGTRSHQVGNALAHLADPLPLSLMLVAIVALAFRSGRRREALAAVAVVLGANLTTQVLKVVLAHSRYQAYLGPHQPWSTAFPSGHTTAAVSVAVALVLAAPRRLRVRVAAVGIAFAAVVATSVVIIEWHYPSDVLGGVLVASGWGFAAIAALRVVEPRRAGVAEAQSASRLAISTK